MATYIPRTLVATVWTLDQEEGKRAFLRFMGSKHFRSLDGLRCVSILAVIWHHVAGDHYPADSLLFMGHHGVTLFFVISGFLITSLLLREKQQTNTISLSGFFIRRTLRIFPVYYLVLLIYCALVFVLERHSEAGKSFYNNLIYFATYTSNYFVMLNGDRVIFYFAWSLAAEEQFYLVWPAIEKWLNEKAAIGMAVLAILLSIMASNSYLPFEPSNLLSVILENIAIPICIGVLLAHAMNNEWTYILLHQLLSGRYTPWLILILSLLVLTLPNTFLIGVYILFAALLFCAVTRNSGVMDTLCNQNWAIAIGQVSYGMYLFHMLAVNAARRVLPAEGLSGYNVLDQLLLFTLTSALTFFIAKLSFIYFESYFLKKKRAYHTKKSSQVRP